ncbi:MAG: diacylglycerol kinase [Desulfobacterales bacterium]|nr:MAG: diacylglycerol kinase [Desulfobacterales bacterium]
MRVQKETALQHIINATRYSVAGFTTAWKNETAFRLEPSVIAFMLPVGFWLGKTAVERALLVGSCLIILITELLNSAIEAVVDRIGLDRNTLSKRAKDLGSAAVFISLLTAGAVWALMVYARFWGGAD